MFISYIGLAIITAAWLFQLYKVYKGDNEIKKVFIAIYMIGAALLVIDAGMTDVALFQVITLIASALVLIRMATFKKTAVKKKKR